MTKTPCCRPAPRTGVTSVLLVKATVNSLSYAGYPVGSEQRALGVDRNGEPVGIVGAGVVHEPVAHAQDAPVPVHRQLGLVHLPPLLRRRGEALQPVLDPLERPAEPHRGPGEEHLLGIEHHDLGPEPAADERRDHPHLRLEQAEHAGETVPDGNRRLGGVPDGELLGARVPRRRRCRGSRSPRRRRGRRGSAGRPPAPRRRGPGA